jgi:indolepyruvate ferredoxin oxidoreductase
MDFVKGVARAEAAVVPDATELTEAVARNLYKLMAYKDEYEVARLHLDEAARAAVTQEFGAAVKIYWHIHPPIFRAMGLNRKLVLGAWFKPAFQVLRAMRGVRGTRWDLFGYAKMRRLERQLIDEYRSTIQDVLPQLTLGNRALMVELASLPDMVRGYEEVKLRNVGRYEARRRELAETLVSPDAPLAEELKAPV